MPDEDRAEHVAADLKAFGLADTQVFSGEAHVPFEEVSPDARSVFRRLSLRHRLLTGERPRAIVASAAAVQGRWLPDAVFTQATELWVRGQDLPRDHLLAHVVRCGYQPANLVEDEGTFAARGGIVDLWRPGDEAPTRLDMFGDELASIKQFDPVSQRARAALESVAVHPIREVIFDDEHVARALARLQEIAEHEDIPTRKLNSVSEEVSQRNYFYGVEVLWPLFYQGSAAVWDALAAGATVVLDDPHAIEAALAERWQRAVQERERARGHHRLVTEVDAHLEEPASLTARLNAGARVRALKLAVEAEERPEPVALTDWQALVRDIEERRQHPSRGEILDPVAGEVRRLVGEGYEVFLACASRGAAERLRELMLARKIDLPLLSALPPASGLGLAGSGRRAPRLGVVVAALESGFVDHRHRVAFLTDGEIFGTPRALPARRRAPAEGLATLKALAEGDLVVHIDHGVGRYLGLKRLVLDGADGDYVHLEYDGGDRLYLPVYRLKLLQRYRGPSDGVRLDKLGGTRWFRAKERVKDAVLALAHGLLAVQARRKVLKGLAVAPPGEHFRTFEAAFPFEETPDQQRAIDEVIVDLGKDRPMDRLICGDVGFGKTEVAIRAAYLVLAAGRQVAVLVPTTVLAEQHGMSFRERLQGEPVTIEVLSRFRVPAATRAILAATRAGKVDILIGTHRMLSSDVGFKSLGLVIIDEEHRFGVRQKERLKQLRSEVHVLTLTATPIPRTMHMAMTGLRDLSIIQTPPAERVSIRTEVTRFDDVVIREAIERELHRGGQVFVVHNRVHSIETMANVIRRLVPQARLAVAHGQMNAERLEKIMLDFVRHEYNVLVCTAIIESGIDIPAANTMIVHRADTFGLAQLYQLRGRIGRSRERAFAYLLLPRSARIGAEASERLAVLKRFSQLGSGFQIASHDLDLRGAGDLLGADQSGNIHAVGFELYTELLAEAVEQAKGKAGHVEVEPDIKLPVTAVLPESYVPEPMQRLGLYQRMAEGDSDDAIFDVLAEIEDRYGLPPEEVRNLAEVMVIRRRLKVLGVQGLTAGANQEGMRVTLVFAPDPAISTS
ncbi:MAG: transcription-repair coupling factor, partial [Deltaproteobacteria bacterium]|nr:transcription-repair coupling factor [Deltaproteobacteria bacterium]